ncbi:predicted protein [Sclerotinia sclerotiorum 1980 UF-70]|uniref:Uncharacterized protein n=2 Tax=Sclerotinia sclerotiorum (strain ATCC 18683 / 1980 / Ss-1) TaxID=665079 RepID=A7EFL5_SCLS1|nr:predicted protein [Sclerotinia sclerotiorum 1980 UF-70]APA07171.1 hypothetical protein sscle_02g019410 [Sclerotinia sclerotiorum 1980 UF-70]EDO01631.1 predicted protein [Sclerotinia sclerotiorum 1980 UF-70]
MCTNVHIRGPCYCGTNNGQYVELGVKLEKCKYVELGNVHDKYFVYGITYMIQGRCGNCIVIAEEKERVEVQRRERERVEAERREVERREKDQRDASAEEFRELAVRTIMKF